MVLASFGDSSWTNLPGARSQGGNLVFATTNAAQQALTLARAAAAPPHAPHAAALAPQLASLEEAAESFVAALSTHSSEVRALVDEGLHHLLPLCALLPASTTPLIISPS